jgi:hypothetical protein
MYWLDSANLQGGHSSLVVVNTHASKEQGSLADLLRTCKLSLTHEREDSALRIVSEVMTRVKQACQEAIRARFRPAEI